MNEPTSGAATAASDSPPAPRSRFRTRRRVEFADTDLSGLVHFSRYFVFMETAEHQFLESIGATVHTTRDGQEIGWPRVAASCEYLAPVAFGDELEVLVRVARKGRKSMTWAIDFSCRGRPVARGRVTAVCCVVNDPAGLRAIEMPTAISERLAEDGAEATDG